MLTCSLLNSLAGRTMLPIVLGTTSACALSLENVTYTATSTERHTNAASATAASPADAPALNNATVDLSTGYTGTLTLSGSATGNQSILDGNKAFGGRFYLQGTAAAGLVAVRLTGGTEVSLGDMFPAGGGTSNLPKLIVDNASFFGNANSDYTAELVVGNGGAQLNGSSGSSYTFSGKITGTGKFSTRVGENLTADGARVGARNIMTGDVSEFAGTWTTYALEPGKTRFWQFGNGGTCVNGRVGGTFGSAAGTANEGSVNVAFNYSGDYAVDSDFVNAGALELLAGNGTFAGNIDIDSLTINSGAAMTVNRNLTLTGQTVVAGALRGGADIVLTGSENVEESAANDFRNGRIETAGALTLENAVTGNTTLSGATVSLKGKIKVDAAAGGMTITAGTLNVQTTALDAFVNGPVIKGGHVTATATNIGNRSWLTLVGNKDAAAHSLGTVSLDEYSRLILGYLASASATPVPTQVLADSVTLIGNSYLILCHETSLTSKGAITDNGADSYTSVQFGSSLIAESGDIKLQNLGLYKSTLEAKQGSIQANLDDEMLHSTVKASGDINLGTSSWMGKITGATIIEAGGNATLGAVFESEGATLSSGGTITVDKSMTDTASGALQATVTAENLVVNAKTQLNRAGMHINKDLTVNNNMTVTDIQNGSSLGNVAVKDAASADIQAETASTVTASTLTLEGTGTASLARLRVDMHGNVTLTGSSNLILLDASLAHTGATGASLSLGDQSTLTVRLTNLGGGGPAGNGITNYTYEALCFSGLTLSNTGTGTGVIDLSEALLYQYKEWGYDSLTLKLLGDNSSVSGTFDWALAENLQGLNLSLDDSAFAADGTVTISHLKDSSVIPEPASTAAGMVGLVFFVLRRRRGRRSH